MIDDAAFLDRYKHAWNKIKHCVPENIRGGRFIDIGCGIGNGLAAAASHGASLSVGLDRNLQEFAVLRVEEYKTRCERLGISTEKILFLEADISTTSFPEGSFDYGMMLDSAEHVPDPGYFFRWAYKVLRPGGVFVMDTCPLYYSEVGHHIWQYFPADTDPWAHLRPDFVERCKALSVPRWHLQHFEELNRVTHDDLRSAFTDAGFEISLEHRSKPTPERLKLFEVYGKDLDLFKIKENWLFENWILLVGRK